MTKFNLIEKVADWYGFIVVGESQCCLKENGTENSYNFASIDEALKAFYSIMIATNNNLKMCHYKIWSDEELSFIASLVG